jgi:hypothetical protein
MKKSILIFSLLLGCSLLHSNAQIKQSTIDNFSISKNAKDLLSTQNEKVNEDELFVVQKIKLNNYALPIVTLKDVKTTNVVSNKVKDKSKIPTNFEPKIYISKERKKAIAIILIPQYIQNQDGSITKLVDYKLDVQETNTTALNKTTGARVYASNSILATGDWYQISVTENGIYKITYDFLNKLGLNASAINPTNIRLYGNGGEMLAEDNAVFRNDDLVENAIQVVDGGDGKMDQGDYILFYANGPHSILKDSAKKQFTHQYNIYNDVSYYFLNVDKGAGKRIQLENTPITSTQIVTSFNEFQFHEKDSVNIGRYGKMWWGDELNDLPGRTLNKSFAFNIPNIDLSSPITVSTQIGGIQRTAASNLAVSVNGNALTSFFLSPFGYEFYDPQIRVLNDTKAITVNSSSVVLNYKFSKGGSEAVGFIDYIRINARRNLVFNGYLNFADWNSVGIGNVANYQIQNANANTRVWDISNPLQPSLMNSSLNGTVLSFNQKADFLHRFVATDGSILFTPSMVGKISNQNLHNISNKEYIIVSHPSFLSEAKRLAEHHMNKRGYKTIVVTPQEIYNEFSSGSQDISAIRDFAKMLYDKATNPNDMVNYLLLFGDASYDYKNRVANNTNFVPTYETLESVNKILSYPTDDFFGFLDDEENLNDFSSSQISTLDIGIGRITAPKALIAKDIVNKIINYDSPNSFGPWKNNMTFCADDGDGDGTEHMNDAESVVAITVDSLPIYNNNKIYVDALVEQFTPSGARCPDGNTAVREQLYNGTFLLNYNGHGGPHSWCEERIFSQNDINALKNYNKLPLFITATCDFAPYDNPADYSGAEILLSKADGGAIALMSTTQLVFADQNRIMNQNYMYEGFSFQDNGKFPTLGDSYRLSKNLRYVSGMSESTAANFRKFTLLGDPALPLSFPKYDVFTDSINGISTLITQDTLKALNKYTISGHVADKQGNLLTGFNGVVFPSIFDKPKKISTIQNNGEPIVDFYIQNNTIYKGKATVKNGKFSFTFVVPKDINYKIAKGKISYYANNENEDANGFDNTIFVGGSSTTAIADNDGPMIKAYMNSEKFVDGGIVTSNSTLLVKLSDDNGINYTGNSIGHDITATLDKNAQNTYVLNNFFESNLDDYKAGLVKFPINNLAEGTHTLTIKAWDILNNSSETTIAFEVVNSTKGLIKNVYNYPNPFSTKTQFMFEHNMPNQALSVSIQIMTLTGKVVKTIKEQITSEGTRINNIDWDGLDEFGDKIGNGVYVYKLHVKSQSGFSDTKLEKLIILR